MTFLHDLAVVMIAAGLVTLLFHRLKQPVVLGYILAGAIIGPHTLPRALINDQETIRTLSELGIVLLMFSLGLEFNLKKLREVGAVALIAAFLEILLMVWLGYETGLAFGWSVMDSLFLGAMLSISSTTIIVKALADMGISKERFSQMIFGILIIEDILAIAMIALLSSIAMTGSFQVTDVVRTLCKLAIFLAVSLVAGLLTVPRWLGNVARFKSQEMLLIFALGLCFGFSLLAMKLGFSTALGAFLIGAVMAESREIHRIAALVEPVRDMFSAIFFVSVGLMLDPKMLVDYWLPVTIITLVVVAGKILSCSFGTFIAGKYARTSLRVGMGLAQIGEFSFIIAALGLSLGVTSSFLYPIAVAVSAATTLLTPYLIRGTDRAVNLFDRLAPRSLSSALEIYTGWVGRLGNPHSDMTSRLIRRWCWQMALNAVLMAALFLTAAYFGEHPLGWLKRLGMSEVWRKTALWLAAVFCSLPMFIVTTRKLEALGLLIAETKVSEASAGTHTARIRTVVAQAISISGTAILGIYTLVLSSALLPAFPVVVVLLLFIGLMAWLLRRSFLRIYSRAQAALHETLSTLPSKEPETGAKTALSPLLHEADLETIAVANGSPAIGRRIRELQLRTRTGASIVGIERDGENLINPGPDEELHAGDHVLILGTAPQLTAARGCFLPTANV